MREREREKMCMGERACGHFDIFYFKATLLI